MSALVQVAAISGALVQVAVIISAESVWLLSLML